MPTRRPDDLLPLTPLSIAILLALAEEPLHGYALLKALERETDGRAPGAGTLYAALQRMLEEGLIEEKRPRRADDQRRRSYALTGFGRAVASAELDRMRRLVVLGSTRRLVPALGSSK